MNLDTVLEKITVKTAAEAKRLDGKIPYISNENGGYTDTNIYWWTNGFWAGILWQLYGVSKDELFRKTAEQVESRLDEALNGFENIDHDAGFLWLHTAGANYRITGSERSKRRILHAATTLAGRFNPDLNIIRAWNEQWIKGFDSAGGAIIDTMMNLPLLYLASEITGDPRFKSIAARHADTALKHMFRADGSCEHQIVFDVHSGEVIGKPGGQGYESGSAWSRGQAWALYGFSLSYRYTGNIRYLNAAKSCANYFIANVSSTDYIPLADFRAPAEPAYYDTTAGAAAACGLLELSEHLGGYEKPLYVKSAEKMLEAIDEKWCDYDAETDGIVGGGSVSYHESIHHQKIIYGDYFYTEGILRLLGKGFLIW